MALIPARGDGVSGASYTYQDAPGYGTFHYLLEDLDNQGVGKYHGPVRVNVTPVGWPSAQGERVYLPVMLRR